MEYQNILRLLSFFSPCCVEANPQFKTVNVYDGNLERINHRESKDQKKAESNDKNKSQKQDNDGDSPESQKNSNDRKRKVGKSI